MDASEYITMMNGTLRLILWLSLPVLGVAAGMGLLVGLLQAVTPIQDQSMPQVLRLVAMLGLLLGALGPLASLAIPAARMLGVFTMLPILTRLGVTGLLRGGAALAAGELLDQQRGSQSALLPDPSGAEAGVTKTLLLLTSVTVFLGAGGLRRLQEGVFESYALWSAASLLPAFATETGLRTLGVLDRLLSGGLVLASPLNVFELAMAVKGIVHAVGLPIYALVPVSYLGARLTAGQLCGWALPVVRPEEWAC